MASIGETTVITPAAIHWMRVGESRFVSRVERARFEEDVVALVREYLAEWRPEDLARIPEACRPGKVTDGEDIGFVAFRLTQHRCANATDGNDAALLNIMAGFFTVAATRIAELALGEFKRNFN